MYFVSFAGPTFVFFAFLAFFGQTISKIGGVRRELDVGHIARNEMEAAKYVLLALLGTACFFDTNLRNQHALSTLLVADGP